jgi:hypothetical protein
MNFPEKTTGRRPQRGAATETVGMVRVNAGGAETFDPAGRRLPGRGMREREALLGLEAVQIRKLSRGRWILKPGVSGVKVGGGVGDRDAHRRIASRVLMLDDRGLLPVSHHRRIAVIAEHPGTRARSRL